MGKGMAALITDMDQPLGCAAGNALEVIESVQTLQGKGPADLTEITILFGIRMLMLAGKTKDEVEARDILVKHLHSGAAFEKFKQMVKLQGGDPRSLDDFSRLPTAKLKEQVPSPRAGFVEEVHAEQIGKACVLLGAGRTKTDDKVDFAVGVSDLIKEGDEGGERPAAGHDPRQRQGETCRSPRDDRDRLSGSRTGNPRNVRSFTKPFCRKDNIVDHGILEKALKYVKNHWPKAKPSYGLICGSGWSDVVAAFTRERFDCI